MAEDSVSKHSPQDCAICWDCNYPLRGLPEPRCPECGRAFDRDRLETMNVNGRAMGRIARYFIRPPGWPMHLVCIAVFLLLIWPLRRPDTFGTIMFGGQMLWFVVGVVWLGRLSNHAFIVRTYRRPKCEQTQGWRNWLVGPILFVTWVLLLFNQGILQRPAFDLARPEMERLVAEVLANPAAPPAGRRAGVLHVTPHGIHHGGVHLFTGRGFNGRHAGYAWFPEGTEPPPNDDSISVGTVDYYPMGGRWYEYCDYSRSLNPNPPPP